MYQIGPTAVSYTHLDVYKRQTFRKVISVSNQLKEYPIWFVDNPTTPKEAEDIIKYFYNT